MLAGGLGTRLRSVVADRPKCMAPVGDHPFLYYLLQYLHRQGITHVVLALGYKAEQVIDWCNSTTLPLQVSWATEPEPLGTGGAIMYALPRIQHNELFIVNGDTYFEADLPAMYAFHEQQQSELTLALKPMRQFDRYGSVELDASQRVSAFHEKRYCESGLINGGIYLTSRRYLQSLLLPVKFSFEKDVLEKSRLYGFVSDTYFIDIGIPEDYERAKRRLINN